MYVYIYIKNIHIYVLYVCRDFIYMYIYLYIEIGVGFYIRAVRLLPRTTCMETGGEGTSVADSRWAGQFLFGSAESHRHWGSLPIYINIRVYSHTNIIRM